VAVAEAVPDEWQAVEVVELPEFVFLRVSDAMSNTEKTGAAMAILGASPLTLKVDGDVLKVSLIELLKWRRYGGQKRRRWVPSWLDCALPEWRGRVMCDRAARYGNYHDAGAFSNVVPMPLHRDNCHIIDAWGRINDPKHRFWASFQLI
jgi:hypothetical protein